MLNYERKLTRTNTSLRDIDDGKIPSLDKLQKLKRSCTTRQMKNGLSSMSSRTDFRNKEEQSPQIKVHFKVAILGLMSSNKMKILNRFVGKVAMNAADIQQTEKADQPPTMLGDYYNKFSQFSSSIRSLTSSLTNVQRKMCKRTSFVSIKTQVKNDASGACMASSDGIVIYLQKIQMKHVNAYFNFWTFAQKESSPLDEICNENGFDAKENDVLSAGLNKDISEKALRGLLKEANAIAMVYDIKQIESFEYLHLMERLTRKINVYRMLIRNGEEDDFIHVVQRDHDLLASNFDAHMHVCGGSGRNVAHCFNKLMADIIRKSKLLDVKNEQDLTKLKGKKLEN